MLHSPRTSSPWPAPLSLNIDGLAPRLTDTGLPPTPPLDFDHIPGDFTILEAPLIHADDVPVVAVVGVGYVGTHLVDVFASHYDTIGFDISRARVDQVRKEFAANPRASFTSDPADLAAATHFLISVPTLLLADKSIDSSYLRSAIQTVAAHARPGATIVIESSVAVGMTREVLGPVAMAMGFFAGMSPERVDPGRTEPAAYEIPKVVSGLDDLCPGSLDSILRLYSRAFNRVVPVSSPEVAEMTKLYENCQRMMCIAYANEMADACVAHGIDPHEVCDAAATKPFGYMPYSPGVGVGGHCIPVNPYYLLSDSSFPLLQAATETMWSRPAQLAGQCLEILEGKTDRTLPPSPGPEKKARVLVVGVGFKVGQSTLSNSPGVDVLKRFAASDKVDVMFADSLVTQDMLPHIPRLGDDEWNEGELQGFDMVVVTMRQVGLDFAVLETVPSSTEVVYLCR